MILSGFRECGKNHNIYAKFDNDENLDKEMLKRGFAPFPKDAKIKCSCGFEIDLLGVKNDVETKSRKK